MKRVAIGIAALTLTCMAGIAFAATSTQVDAARNKGLMWLFQQQAGDGSWRSKPGTEIPATASAIQALTTAQLRGQPFARAVSWLANAEAGSVDALARQTVALAGAGVNVSAYVNQLDARRNRTDRAVWGAYDHFGTSFPDTALAIGALRVGRLTGGTGELAYQSTDVRKAFYCELLRAQRASDSSWPYTADIGTGTAAPSQFVSGSILPTVYALLELHAFNGSTGWNAVDCDAASQTPPGSVTLSSSNVAAAIRNGVTWLLTKRNSTSGGFGDGASTTVTVLETALAYSALKTMQTYLDGLTPTLSTSTEREAALDYLLAQQNGTTGSWGNGDALLTAFVLSVLPAPATALTDTDGDGIPDAVETLMGKSTTVADSRPAAGSGTGGGTQGLSSGGPLAVTLGFMCSITQQIPAPSGGAGAYTYAISSGALPTGLALAASTGVISGTPKAMGTYGFGYTMSDAAGNTLTLPGSITVAITNAACIAPLLSILLDDD